MKNREYIIKGKLDLDVEDVDMIIASLKIFQEVHNRNAERTLMTLGENEFEKIFSEVSKRSSKLIKMFETIIK